MPTFVEDFAGLLLKEPRYNVKIVNSENCDYADTALNSKNCYYTFGAFHSEMLFYSRYSRNCNSCSDMTFSFECEWCYDCVACNKCYSCDYCRYCSNCAHIAFCEDCTGCKDCLGCIGMYQRQYCIFNTQLTKEEYARRLGEFDLNNPHHRQLIKKRVEELKCTTPILGIHQTQTENCTGENLVQAKNAHMCFDAYDLEDCGYCIEVNSLKNCYDMTVNFKTQESYQCIHCPLCYNCNFCYHADGCSDSEYCAHSSNLHDCFGCVYLKDKQFYILNLPYSEMEYHEKVAEIKAELLAAGMYNLNPYFISPYEQGRLATESDPAIQFKNF